MGDREPLGPGGRAFFARRDLVRVLLLALVLVAFARVLWRLDGVNLWWDESLSLQRAESEWPGLLLGRIDISDGRQVIATRDQHPFFFFALLRLFIDRAGIDEFALRMPAAMAATLMVPAAWIFARRLEHMEVALPGAAIWSALLVGLSPYHLWFGQEVRMYTLVALLALLSTYWLVRWCWPATVPGAQPVGSTRDRRALIRYGVFALLLALTHFFALYLFPLHILLVLVRMGRDHPRRGLLLAGALAAVLLAAGLTISWWILSQPGAGGNFTAVRLPVLLGDLLNSFSVGPSLGVARILWLNLVIGTVAVVGMAAGLRRRDLWWQGGWLLTVYLLAPPLLLWLVNLVLPSYMTSRHMSMISGAYLVAVGAGLAWLWSVRRPLGGLVAAVVVAGLIYGNVHFYTHPYLRITDFAGVGDTLRDHLQPGDLVLVHPAEMGRLYRYYLPDELVAAQPAPGDLGWQIMPLLDDDPATTRALLADLHGRFRRIWFARTSPLITNDLDRLTDEWLEENAFRVKEYGFESYASVLKLFLYLPEPTVYDSAAAVAIPNAQPAEGGPELPGGVVFGDRIRLRGYGLWAPLVEGVSLPVSLYWEPLTPIDRRYKYILQLARPTEQGLAIVAHTEREPYEGAIATAFWQDPGKIILEYSELDLGETDPSAQPGHALLPFRGIPDDYLLLLQLYDMETLEKLPVTGGPMLDDGVTAVLPAAGLAGGDHGP